MARQPTARSRRFSLPDHADERTDEAIEAFLTGPTGLHRRGRAADSSLTAIGPIDALGGLVPRLTWNYALEREAARARRYKRPASVVVVTIEPRASRTVGDGGPSDQGDGWPGRIARPLAHAIRRGARETDLVTRATESRFQVLLPETPERDARHFAERIVADCEVWLSSLDAPVRVRAVAVGTTAERALGAALEEAIAS